MKKSLSILCLLILITGFASCSKYPQEPLVVKATNINQNPVQYDRTMVAVKGQVTAIGTQPNLQIGWYDLTDDTDTIRIRTTPSDIPKVREELWVSGTFMSNENIIQEREKIRINSFPWIYVVFGAIAFVLIGLLMVLLLMPKSKTQYQPVGGAYPPPRPMTPPPPPPPSYTPAPPSPPKSSATMMDAPKPQRSASETFIADDRADPVLAYLIVKTGARSGTNYPLKKAIIKIGREQGNDIVIDDKKTSREHAKLKMEDGKFVLYDLASSNGTFVNGVKIQNQSIMDSDEIQIGESLLVFKTV
ncbi:MAG TPA: FHA domain-containing protein [Caldisericia bacterium]|nr:FHA domain-containing protein [Caldisericia bacterium]